MKEIKQKGSKDCGAACIAMIAEVKYERAYAALYKWDKPWAADFSEMKRALKRLKIKTSPSLQSCFGNPDDHLTTKFDAIVRVNHRKAAKEGHWVVWDSQASKFLDPLKKPYKKLRVHAYIKIVR